MEQILKDRRKRNLAILGGLALISVVLAVLSLHREAATTTPKRVEETFFPQLPGQAKKIARIRVASRAHGTFDVVFDPQRGWILPEHGNYPASFDQLKMTVVGIAALQTIQPETARSDWLHYLDLDAPPNGSGTEFTLQDERGHTLATLIAGKATDIGDSGGAIGLYVRKPNSKQTWLVRSVFEPKSDPADWLEKSVLTVDRSRIQDVEIVAPNGSSFSVHRNKPSDADFAIIPTPAGRQEAYPGAGDTVGGVITGFSFIDVRPASSFDFSGAQHVITKTFDGLAVTVQIIKQGTDYWATVYAEGPAGRPDAAAEARDIDSHTNGWAYKLPPEKGQTFMTTLDSLLKPLATKK
ncbi:MAG TPA: DUF4340 domain-containing protein [Rhizomicrobium sp.]|nr:DUF4340 domain-containing protein [Rhizomicrobium sp.]